MRFILNCEMKSAIKFYRCDSHFLLCLLQNISKPVILHVIVFSDPNKKYHFIWASLVPHQVWVDMMKNIDCPLE